MPVFKCTECEKIAEPPFDSEEFQMWLDAGGWTDDQILCVACADIDAVRELKNYTTIIVEDDNAE